MTWQELIAGDLEKVLAWANDQSWCRAMAECQQDAEWHAEGDVWTHTKMVCMQLTLLDEWQSLTRQEQLTLFFTALFHDAAKPLTSQLDVETGRIRSPKHAVKGEHLARSILRELGCDLTTRETIARLVRYHGRPSFLLDKENQAREIVSLSWQVSHRLLYLFALADTRGRTTESMNRPEENLEFWRLMAEELNCFTHPYLFANDQARLQYLQSPEADLHYVPHEMYRCTVVMMSGLPGSGKDTWLLNHRPQLPVVSLDDIRAELDVDATDNQGQVIQQAKERCRELLRIKTDFAFNATNLLRQTRQGWLKLFFDYGARVEIIYIEPPLAEIYRQNKQRQRHVPTEVIRKLAEKCEPPTWAEAHQIVLLP
jgi:predicted kinase